MSITLLDGPIGTVLIDRGHPAPPPAWSASCISTAPGAISSLHQEYAEAGATHHTTNTFRTRAANVGSEWKSLTEKAVALTRSSTPIHHTIMGCIAPIADCYRPDLSPMNPGPEHQMMANHLALSGVDLILCETFPHIDEGLAAAQAALNTNTETWLSFTAGPNEDLLSIKEIRQGAARASEMGVSAILVNCVPAVNAHRYLDAISGHGIPFGIYANAGSPQDGIGWGSDKDGAKRYAELATHWAEIGATLIGSCCGTGPAHIRALNSVFNPR